jgi:ferredoxin-nitrite reductase
MRYLVQELGPEGFRAAVDARTRLTLQPAGTDLTTGYRGDHVGVHAQRDEGLFYVGCSVPVGRMRGIELVEAARLSRTYGDGTVRLGTDQNFVLTGVPEDRLDDLLAEELVQKYSPFPGPFERGVMACTGSEFCRFAVVETKERGVKLARWLDSQLAKDPDGPSPVPIALGKRPENSRSVRGEDRGVIRMHFSGCSASCAQPQIADIGLRGDVAHVGEHIEEAVDIGLGGSLGPDAAFIDWIAGAVPVDTAPAALSNLLVRFANDRRNEEPFYAWARRVENSELRAIMVGADVGASGGAS